MTVALVTGGRDFCEIRPGADHMGERRALGFALDWVKPSAVMAMAGEDGPSRLAQIWCERRGVEFSAKVRQQPEIVIAFPGASDAALRRARELEIDVFEVSVK